MVSTFKIITLATALEEKLIDLDKDSKKSKWKCSICGYIHEADELPDDFKCPICGVGKEYFELVED